MPLRRNLAIALGAVALCLPTVSACGFEPSTNRPYTPAAGANADDGVLKVLGAVVVSANPGSGTFVASLSNDDRTTADAFDSLTPGTGSDFGAGTFTPVEVKPGALVNLATDGGVPVTGDFNSGNFLSVVVGFTSGGRVEMKVPVVADGGDFAGLDTSSPAATESPASASPTAEATVSE